MPGTVRSLFSIVAGCDFVAPGITYGNRAKRVPFRRTGALALCVIAALLMSASLGIAQDAPASSSSAQANSFLKLSDGQRYWWLHGAATTTAHMIAMYDERKGDCAAKWYLDDRAAAQKLVEDTLRRHPAEGPTTVVISLMTQACGELTPAANR